MGKREPMNVGSGRGNPALPTIKDFNRIRLGGSVPRSKSGSGRMYCGINSNGYAVHGTVGDILRVPQDLCKISADKLVGSGLATICDTEGNFKETIPAISAFEKRKTQRAEAVRKSVAVIESIQIISAGQRTATTAFFLGKSNGIKLTGKVGDYFSITDGEISEELAKKLIAKKYAEIKKNH